MSVQLTSASFILIVSGRRQFFISFLVSNIYHFDPCDISELYQMVGGRWGSSQQDTVILLI